MDAQLSGKAAHAAHGSVIQREGHRLPLVLLVVLIKLGDAGDGRSGNGQVPHIGQLLRPREVRVILSGRNLCVYLEVNRV